ncbi:hypothetical protein GCM10027215_05860 [Nocardioides zeae]
MSVSGRTALDSDGDGDTGGEVGDEREPGRRRHQFRGEPGRLVAVPAGGPPERAATAESSQSEGMYVSVVRCVGGSQWPTSSNSPRLFTRTRDHDPQQWIWPTFIQRFGLRSNVFTTF